MGEASQAFDENQFDVAAAKYQAALAMRPRSPEALNGMAGLLTKEKQFPAAANAYEQLIKVQPRSVDAWRGLFLAYARERGKPESAWPFPPASPPRSKHRWPRIRNICSLSPPSIIAENRPADAQRALAQALALPFPDNGRKVKADTRLQYAGILMGAKRYARPQELYAQILNEDPGSLPAWMGLVSAHHELGQDTQAIVDVEKMPPATYEAALADPGFLSMLGSI